MPGITEIGVGDALKRAASKAPVYLLNLSTSWPDVGQAIFKANFRGDAGLLELLEEHAFALSRIRGIDEATVKITNLYSQRTYCFQFEADRFKKIRATECSCIGCALGCLRE